MGGCVKYNPVKYGEYIAKKFGDTLDPWQREELTRFGRVLNGEIPNLRISLPAAHGVGKTFLASLIITYALSVVPRIAGVATSNTRQQLITKLVREIQKVIPYNPGLKCTTYGVRRITKPSNVVSFVTFDPTMPESFQGLHEEFVLIVIDEASGLPDDLFRVLEGALSGGRFYYLLLGNPTKLGTYFHKTVTDYKHIWVSRPISCFDSHRVSPSYSENMDTLYGKDSDMYRVRVLGLFPKISGGDSNLFKTSDFKNVFEEKFEGCLDGERSLGMDVGAGGDKTVLVDVTVNKELKIISINSINPYGEADLVKVARLPIDYMRDIDFFDFDLNMDSTGLGAGVSHMLAEIIRNNNLSTRLNPFNFSSKPIYLDDPYNAKNIRTMLYTNLKKLLVLGWRIYGMPEDLVKLLLTIVFRSDTLYLEIVNKSKDQNHDALDALLLSIIFV